MTNKLVSTRPFLKHKTPVEPFLQIAVSNLILWEETRCSQLSDMPTKPLINSSTFAIQGSLINYQVKTLPMKWFGLTHPLLLVFQTTLNKNRPHRYITTKTIATWVPFNSHTIFSTYFYSSHNPRTYSVNRQKSK